MSDYKELIDELREIERYGASMVDSYDAGLYADAIEQLVKERDAAIRDMREYIDCGVCKYNTDEYLENGWCRECSVGKSTREHWEWRGTR